MAQPLSFASEAQLRDEIASIQAKLASTIGWVERIRSLQRLESLVLGGSDRWPSFMEGMKTLKDPLIAQVDQLSDSRATFCLILD